MAKRKTPEERLAELAVDRQFIARWIAVGGGVLSPCGEHFGSFMAIEGADIKDAYHIGDQMLGEGMLKRLFRDREQVVAAINAAVLEFPNLRCLVCEPPKPH